MIRNGIALLTLFMLGISSTALVRAADEQKPRKPGEGARDPAKMQEILKKFDKDGDGKLSDAERQEAMKARGGAPGAGGPPGGRIDPAKLQELVKKYDKDGDGQLNDTEKQAAREEFMKLRGGPAGGKPGEGGRPNMQEILKKFDKDGDGKLNDAEKAEAMKARGANGAPRKKPENK
jgi:Ca2+-binding EF-hand superfamily protein